MHEIFAMLTSTNLLKYAFFEFFTISDLKSSILSQLSDAKLSVDNNSYITEGITQIVSDVLNHRIINLRG